MYGYFVDGEGGWERGYRWEESRMLLDPYAPLVISRQKWAERDELEQFVHNVSELNVALNFHMRC